MDRNQVLHQIQGFRGAEKDALWASRLLYLCEHIWSAMGDPNLFDRTLSPQTAAAFASLLADDSDCFALAQQVIPELRTCGRQVEVSRYRQQVLERLDAQRTDSVARQASTQASFDTPAYAREKDTFREAELYRTRLHLQRSEHLSPAEREEVVEWLDKCPLALHRAAQQVEAERKNKRKASEYVRGRKKDDVDRDIEGDSSSGSSDSEL